MFSKGFYCGKFKMEKYTLPDRPQTAPEARSKKAVKVGESIIKPGAAPVSAPSRPSPGSPPPSAPMGQGRRRRTMKKRKVHRRKTHHRRR